MFIALLSVAWFVASGSECYFSLCNDTIPSWTPHSSQVARDMIEEDKGLYLWLNLAKKKRDSTR